MILADRRLSSNIKLGVEEWIIAKVLYAVKIRGSMALFNNKVYRRKYSVGETKTNKETPVLARRSLGIDVAESHS